MLDLSKKYDKKIIIKEKSRLKGDSKSHYLYLEEKYKNIEVILDCEDDNKLIAKAMFSISAPSTLCFKLIQLGVPTLILKNYGMTGNFEDYDGLIDINNSNVNIEIEKQINKGRDGAFIRNILEGGIDFSSTRIYVDNIKKIIRNEK